MLQRDKLLSSFSDPIRVLDHGYVKLVDVMGDDDAIAQAARVSYQQGTKSMRQNVELIRYLMRHGHLSPFEMCEIKVGIRAPIFVARQIVRHRTSNWNELSGRYSEIPADYYVPAVSRMNPQGGVSIQSSNEGATIAGVDAARFSLECSCEESVSVYKELLSRYELSREVARTVLPLGVYTEWFWKIDLRNMLNFLKLRLDTHAQYEIRVYAEALAAIVSQWVPATWAAFQDYVVNSVTLTSVELAALRRLLPKIASTDLRGDADSQDKLDPERLLSRGEWKEFLGKLERLLGYSES
jgi:thymidylate synthase (FAD)